MSVMPIPVFVLVSNILLIAVKQFSYFLSIFVSEMPTAVDVICVIRQWNNTIFVLGNLHCLFQGCCTYFYISAHLPGYRDSPLRKFAIIIFRFHARMFLRLCYLIPLLLFPQLSLHLTPPAVQ